MTELAKACTILLLLCYFLSGHHRLRPAVLNSLKIDSARYVNLPTSNYPTCKWRRRYERFHHFRCGVSFHTRTNEDNWSTSQTGTLLPSPHSVEKTKALGQRQSHREDGADQVLYMCLESVKVTPWVRVKLGQISSLDRFHAAPSDAKIP
jgi:hypothetical protein